MYNADRRSGFARRFVAADMDGIRVKDAVTKQAFLIELSAVKHLIAMGIEKEHGPRHRFASLGVFSWTQCAWYEHRRNFPHTVETPCNLF